MTSWEQEYEQRLVKARDYCETSSKSPMSDEQFEKYVEYIEMMTNIEDTNCDLAATNQI